MVKPLPLCSIKYNLIPSLRPSVCFYGNSKLRSFTFCLLFCVAQPWNLIRRGKRVKWRMFEVLLWAISSMQRIWHILKCRVYIYIEYIQFVALPLLSDTSHWLSLWTLKKNNGSSCVCCSMHRMSKLCTIRKSSFGSTFRTGHMMVVRLLSDGRRV